MARREQRLGHISDASSRELASGGNALPESRGGISRGAGHACSLDAVGRRHVLSLVKRHETNRRRVKRRTYLAAAVHIHPIHLDSLVVLSTIKRIETKMSCERIFEAFGCKGHWMTLMTSGRGWKKEYERWCKDEYKAAVHRAMKQDGGVAVLKDQSPSGGDELTDEVNTLAANLRTQESGFDSGPRGLKAEAPEMVEGQRRTEGGKHLKLRDVVARGTKPRQIEGDKARRSHLTRERRASRLHAIRSRCRDEVRTDCDDALAQEVRHLDPPDSGHGGGKRIDAVPVREVSLRLNLRTPSQPGLTGEGELSRN
ncbi:hypothetical protein B0H14DRAFT_3136482 [Mycena olivaceomarginata]|nr:hypothetical protein B0H14DRAFT_3136482 [Mycena olivaceomarginata]